MKGKLKQTKGITLIALIITIIILLILAVVSIRLVMNDGILGKAETAVKTYTEEETNEKIQLAYTDYQMGKLADSSYTFEQALQNGKVAYTSVTGSDAEGYIVTATLSDGTVKKYKVTSAGVSKLKTTVEEYGLKIGDYVAYNEAGTGNYTADTSKGLGRSGTFNSTTKRWELTPGDAYTTENLGWRVLGVNDKGELELISDNPMSVSIAVVNEEGYLFGVDELNKMCNILYGNGKDSTGKVVAVRARSLDVEDVNTLVNYNPISYKPCIYRYPTQNEMDEFTGSENSTRYMQYSMDEGMSWHNITDTINGQLDMSCQSFSMPWEGVTLSSESPGSKKLVRTFYLYEVEKSLAQKLVDGKSLGSMICRGSSGGYCKQQWLASACINTYASYAVFGLRILDYQGWLTDNTCFYSSDCSPNSGVFKLVRPIVDLKTDVQIEKTDANDGSTLAKACIIK